VFAPLSGCFAVRGAWRGPKIPTLPATHSRLPTTDVGFVWYASSPPFLLLLSHQPQVFSNVSAAGFDTPPVRLSLAPSWPTCPVPLRIRLALAPACFAGDVCLSPGSLAVSCAQPDASSLALLLKDALTRVRVAFAVYDAGLLGSGEATLGQAVVSLAGAVRWSLASNAGGSGEGDPRGAIGATAPPRYRFSSALTRLGRRTGWLQGALQVYMLQI